MKPVTYAVTFTALRNSVLGTVLLGLSLYLWSRLYLWSDWAALVLAPLAVMLFVGHLCTNLHLYRARMNVVIRHESSLRVILTGRINATVKAALFVLVAMPLLAWKALSLDVLQAAIFIVLSLVAGLVFVTVQSVLSIHFYQPFVRASAVSISSWLVSLVFVPLIAWANMNLVLHPGAIRIAGSLADAALYGMQMLPVRRGWIAEALAPLYAYEAGKLWLVVQLHGSRWPAVLFSLDAALFSFVVARISGVLGMLIQSQNLYDRR